MLSLMGKLHLVAIGAIAVAASGCAKTGGQAPSQKGSVAEQANNTLAPLPAKPVLKQQLTAKAAPGSTLPPERQGALVDTGNQVYQGLVEAGGH